MEQGWCGGWVKKDQIRNKFESKSFKRINRQNDEGWY